MKKHVKIILFSLLAVLLLLGIFLLGVYLYSSNYSIPSQDTTITNTTGLVQAHDRSLYDASGNSLQLRGVNVGQLLLQEGWMSPFALEPSRNEDGSYIKDTDGNIQYPEFTEIDFRTGLQSNPNLSSYDLETLLQIYRECFFSEEDFRFIREELQMNAIRVPFHYLEILNEDLTLRSEEEAFTYLDWFISNAAEHELYIILDLHGAPGGQNGYEHSGSNSEQPLLWDNEEYRAATVSLWEFIARHYLETRPDLGQWIATYDILNEPTYRAGSVTTRECWDVFDRIYRAIRATGDRHVITMEACWDFSRLPDPADYGWENVQYEYHWYNWWSNLLPYDLFYMYQDVFNITRDYEVPVLIGEFTLFEDKGMWARELAMFDDRNYSWTIWNYKTTVTGWWTSSWGVHTCQLKFTTENEETKCNVATCSYEEYVDTCQKVKTENCVTDTLYQVLADYNQTK